jgi:hypothetical protein
MCQVLTVHSGAVEDSVSRVTGLLFTDVSGLRTFEPSANIQR